MTLHFSKYQGTGNDFILIDQRIQRYIQKGDVELIRQLCDRRFGIGADGLILLESSTDYDFKMIYFNSDGNESSMCGNGGRCIIHFANSLHLFKERCIFEAIDGLHEGVLKEDWVHLKMTDVDQISKNDNAYVLDTGSPHYVQFVEEEKDIVAFGRSIRYNETYKKEGINVNLVKQEGTYLEVQTYERGVEDETYSCGTGATACALVAHKMYNLPSPIDIEVKGGRLQVAFDYSNQGYKNIWLSGPAVCVFEGKIET